MATLPFAIDELTANHLDGLISAEAAEGISLEFKSEPYDHDHEGVREFLKDITSLANTGGGFLLIGVREEQGVAKAITPVTSPDSDKMKQRLESLLQTAVEPRIFGIRIQPVTVPGGYVLAIRVPRSGTPPHRVTAKNSNRFYLRSSAGTYEASMDELRRLFAQDGATRGRLETFLDERIRMISSGKTSVPIESRDRLVLHIIPLAAQGFGNAVNLSRAHELNLKFRTMGNHGGFSPRFNIDGFVNSSGRTPAEAYTQIFRDGTVEAVTDGLLGTAIDKPVVPAVRVQDQLIEATASYLDALNELDVAPPLYIQITLTGVKDAWVACMQQPGTLYSQPPSLNIEIFKLPVCVVEDYGNPAFYRARLKPAFDALWNAGGRSEWPG